MAIFRAQIVRSLLFSQMMLFFVWSMEAVERDVSVDKLHYELSEKFLVNRQACRIPNMNPTLRVLKDVDRTDAPYHTRYVGGLKRWLSELTRSVKNEMDSSMRKKRKLSKKEKRQLRNKRKEAKLSKKEKKREEKRSIWRAKFQEKHQALLASGKGWRSCIILDHAHRRLCCKKRVKYRGSSWRRSQFKLDLCMKMVTEYAKMLLEKGVMLKASDEGRLDDELEKILKRMDKDKIAGMSIKSSLWFETARARREDQNVPVARARRKNRSRYSQLVKFLASMKQIEKMLMFEQNGSTLAPEHRRSYSEFLKVFSECYKKKKTGVIYHAVEQRWLTCGPVKMGKDTAAYCADLSGLDESAPELGRKPVLKWETGGSEGVREYLDGKTRVVRSLISGSVGEDMPAVNRATENYVLVELFAKSCSVADLAVSCHAMCCDSVYRYSYMCQTGGMECVG